MKIENKTFAARVGVFALVLSSMISGPAFAAQYTEYGQNWSQIFDPNFAVGGMSGFGAVATSDDGKIVYSLIPTSIFRSTDYGITWTNIKNQYVPIGSSTYRSMDVSSDGSIIVIAEDSGYVWRSTNFGDSWVKMPQIGSLAISWQAVSVSGTGQRIILFNMQDRYISNNSGASFTKITDPNIGSVGSMSASDDGSVILIVDQNRFNPCESGVYISQNSGTTFSQINSNLPTQCGSGYWVEAVGVSGDGGTLVATSYGKTMVSKDAGASWSQSTLPTGATGGWGRLTISQDGSRIALMRYYNSPLTSDDFGATFNERNTFAAATSSLWISIASSSDGSRLYMAGDNGLYTSVINELLITSNYGTVTLLLDTCLSDTSTSTSVMAASVVLLTDTASAIANSETSTYIYFSETDTALWGANYSYGSTQNAQTCGYRDMNGTVTLTRGRFMASTNSLVLSETTTNQSDFIQYIGNTETASAYSGLACGNVNASPRNTSNVTTSCTTAIQANYQQLTYLNSIQVRDSNVKSGVLGQASGKIYTHVKVKKSAIAGAANGTTWVAVETLTVTSS
jgi:photosystem II stability/assembly factor-like uncharacterized protein